MAKRVIQDALSRNISSNGSDNLMRMDGITILGGYQF